MNYHDELCAAMKWLGEQPGVFFFGQGVGNAGTSLSDTFKDVPDERRIEMPVAEEMQVGMCVGMSLRDGLVPVCVIPRWNFALRAADQIINHMDRLPLYSAGGYKPHVIVRIAAPSVRPFYPQAQHDGDFTEAFKSMLRTVKVVRLPDAAEIVGAYQAAYYEPGSTILVEYTEAYKNERGRKQTTGL